MAEAFSIADGAGVSRQDLYNVMSAGPLHSMMMDFVKSYAVDGDPNKLEFAIVNAAKDLGYYAQMTKEMGTESLISAGTVKALHEAVEQGPPAVGVRMLLSA